MRFYATRTEAIQRTYSALQQLDQRRKGSPNPSRAIRVATFYGHLQCRANAAGSVQLALRELASSWHLQPRLLREDLADLQALGWLNFRSDAFGTQVQLLAISDQPTGELEPAEQSRGDQATADQQSAEPQADEPEAIQSTAKPATTPSQSQLIAQFAALYNQHKPKSWPAYSPNGNSLAARLQRAIRHAGGPKVFDQVLIQALQAMPEFWRNVYPQGRTGGACVAALLSGDRSTTGLGVEFWHVFSWGAPGSSAMGPGATASAASCQGSSAESDPDFRRACRLFVWGDHAWRGQGMEAFELPDQEKQRLTELLEAAGLGSPGQAAKQFAPSINP
jgi:hypothetical protein